MPKGSVEKKDGSSYSRNGMLLVDQELLGRDILDILDHKNIPEKHMETFPCPVNARGRGMFSN